MKSSPRSFPPARPLRILAAEDNTMLGEVLVKLLTDVGHVCQHVENGLLAWDVLSADLEAFNLVITDHQMPSLTGLELVELLHQAGYRGRVIVYSSVLTEEEKERYRRFGISTILMKTSRLDELLRAVHAEPSV